MGRSSELKTLKNAEKVKWGPTDQRTKRGVESRSTRLKKVKMRRKRMRGGGGGGGGGGGDEEGKLRR